MASESETLKKDMADLRTSLDKLTKDVAAINKAVLDDAKKSNGEFREEVREKAHELVQQARDKGRQSAEAVGTTVSDNPFRSVLIAFGAGVLLSQLIRRH